MSCGCSGNSGAVAGTSALQAQQRSLLCVVGVLAMLWLLSKGRYGTVLAIGLATFAIRHSQQRAATAPGAAVPTNPPGNFAQGTANTQGTATETMTVQGISPTITGSNC